MSLEDLFASVSPEKALEVLLQILETVGVKARSWRRGGTFRTILAGVTRQYSDLTVLSADAIKGRFLDEATGGWLTRLAKLGYGVDRKPATFAQGYVTLTNSSGNEYTEGPDQVVFRHAVTGKAYVNAEPISLIGPSTQTVLVRAVEIGSGSNAAPGTVEVLETQLTGVSVTNVAAVIGSDAETDEELRQACRDKLGILSVRGPRNAYRYAIRIATRNDGSPVDVNKSRISPSSSTGVVHIICRSPSGAPAPEDLQAVRAAAEAVARPDSVTGIVSAAQEVPLTRNLVVWARRRDGIDAAGIKALVEAKLIEAMRDYEIGGIAKDPDPTGFLYADYIAGVVHSAHPSIFDVDGTGADLALEVDEIPILTATIQVRIQDTGSL